VRIVAFAAAAGRERLAEVRLLDGSVLGIVASKAEVRLGLSQMKNAFGFVGRLRSMHCVASAAPHVHGGVLDFLLDLGGDISMAAQAKVLSLVSTFRRAAQKFRSLAAVRIVARNAA